MTERAKMLIASYGPRFQKQCNDILMQMPNLSAYAYCCLTNEEHARFADSLVQFQDELEKIRLIIRAQPKEVTGS